MNEKENLANGISIHTFIILYIVLIVKFSYYILIILYPETAILSFFTPNPQALLKD